MLNCHTHRHVTSVYSGTEIILTTYFYIYLSCYVPKVHRGRKSHKMIKVLIILAPSSLSHLQPPSIAVYDTKTFINRKYIINFWFRPLPVVGFVTSPKMRPTKSKECKNKKVKWFYLEDKPSTLRFNCHQIFSGNDGKNGLMKTNYGASHLQHQNKPNIIYCTRCNK